MKIHGYGSCSLGASASVLSSQRGGVHFSLSVSSGIGGETPGIEEAVIGCAHHYEMLCKSFVLSGQAILVASAEVAQGVLHSSSPQWA